MACRESKRDRGGGRGSGERKRGRDHKVKSILGLRKDNDVISMIYKVGNYE